MVVLCSGCRGPATEREVTVGANTVTIVECPDCDFVKCGTCKVPVPQKHSVRCPHGHVL